MSQENVEIVRRMYEAYVSGDADRALAHFHPDVAADFSIRGDTGPTNGREALGQTVATWVRTWDDYSEQIESIRDVGDTVCVVATQRVAEREAALLSRTGGGSSTRSRKG